MHHSAPIQPNAGRMNVGISPRACTTNEDGVPQTLPSGANNPLFGVARMEILAGEENQP